MPADLTELLERLSAPTMHVDPDTVVARGRRRRARRRLGAVAVVAAAALVVPVSVMALRDGVPSAIPAASLAPDSFAPVPSTAVVNETARSIVLPADVYWLSEPELDEITSATNTAMIACKRSKGVVMEDPRRVIRDEPDDRRFGLWLMEDAQRYGYVQVASDEKKQSIADQSGPSSAPSDGEVEAAAQCAREDATVVELSKQPPNAPRFQALSKAEDDARSSPEWADVTEEWATCLREKGLVPDVDGMSVEGLNSAAMDEGRVLPEDVAIAVADVTCKQQTNLVQRQADLVAAAQAPVIVKYRDEFMQQRADFDAQLTMARQVLRDAGL